MAMSSCSHIVKFLSLTGSGTFHLIYALFVSCSNKSIQRQKKCNICNSRTGRIHACLSCVFFGCSSANHIQKHAKESQHCLSVDTEFGTVYCHQCTDYVYHETLDVIVKKHQMHITNKIKSNDQSVCEPTSRENEHRKSSNINDGSYLGIRGIVNSGNTCFINSILQSLLHTPLLKLHFLSHAVCNEDESSMPFIQEIISLYEDYFSGKCTPLVPHKLLHQIWTNANHLTGYGEQDAHEFLMMILNILHLEYKQVNIDAICNCIIDKVFSGSLRSEIVCTNCKKQSITVDPFWDISLDLITGSQIIQKRSCKNDCESNSSTLLDCLVKFTQLENIEGIVCENCDGYQDFTKQFTFQKLPQVIIFHFKRLSHLGKIEKIISFPETIDLSPFTSNESSIATKSDKILNNSQTNKFELFSVINHIGNMNSGHFISFVRQQQNKWFKCNDYIVSKANVQEILKSEAYILFYHRQIL